MANSGEWKNMSVIEAIRLIKDQKMLLPIIQREYVWDMILEINKQNYRYLDDTYQQGFKNSDGNVRSAKISIPKKNLPNFIIHEHN